MTQSKGSFRPHTVEDFGQPEYLDGAQMQFALADENGRRSAYVATGTDAILYAAAPALLEACKQAEAQFADLAAITINGEHDARDQAAIEALRAAIQSATGEG